MKEKENIKTDEDYEIVTLCKQGNVDAFETLVKKHQKKMLNVAYRMLGNYEDACEIVQDAFVSAYKNIRKFGGESRFSTWIYVIVMNLSKNRIKQLKIKLHCEHSIDDPVLTDNTGKKIEPASNEPSILKIIEKREIQQKIQECINTLDSEFKEVIVLRDIQGFSYDEISAILKIAEGTVKSRLFRARDAVKDCLKKVIGEL